MSIELLCTVVISRFGIGVQGTNLRTPGMPRWRRDSAWLALDSELSCTGITKPIIPLGLEPRVTAESLNQKNLRCLSTNHRQCHVFMYSLCLVNAFGVWPELDAVLVIGLLRLAHRGRCVIGFLIPVHEISFQSEFQASCVCICVERLLS